MGISREMFLAVCLCYAMVIIGVLGFSCSIGWAFLIIAGSS